MTSNFLQFMRFDSLNSKIDFQCYLPNGACGVPLKRDNTGFWALTWWICAQLDTLICTHLPRRVSKCFAHGRPSYALIGYSTSACSYLKTGFAAISLYSLTVANASLIEILGATKGKSSLLANQQLVGYEDNLSPNMTIFWCLCNAVRSLCMLAHSLQLLPSQLAGLWVSTVVLNSSLSLKCSLHFHFFYIQLLMLRECGASVPRVEVRWLVPPWLNRVYGCF